MVKIIWINSYRETLILLKNVIKVQVVFEDKLEIQIGRSQ